MGDVTRSEDDVDAVACCSQQTTGPSRWRSTRFTVCYLACSGMIVIFLQRVSLSMAIVCMVNHTAVITLHRQHGASLLPGLNSSETITAGVSHTNDYNVSASSCGKRCQSLDDNGSVSDKEEDGPFVWDKPTQGLLLASVYVGFTVMQIPGSYVIHRYGVRLVAGASIVIMSVCHALCHPAALLSPWVVVVLRVIMGVCTEDQQHTAGADFAGMYTRRQAFTGTAMYGVWTQWAPKSEQAQLLGLTFAGETVASAVVFPLSALLCQYGFWGGWPSVFYVFGGLGVVWSVAWFLLMTDSPETHPRISPGERHFIVTTRAASTPHTEKFQVPWRTMAQSPCVWAIAVAHFSHNWLYFQMISNLPTFLYETMHFDIKSNGVYSMLPYIALFVVMSCTGFVTDAIIKRRLLSVLAVRKLVTILAFLVPAVLLVVMSHLPCEQVVVVVSLLVLAVGVSGLTLAGGFYVNPYDIAPRYAINICTLSSTISTMSGVINPYIVAAMTLDQTREQWQMVFYVTGGVLVAGTVIFCLLAKGHVQHWARPPQLQADVITVGLAEHQRLNAEVKC